MAWDLRELFDLRAAFHTGGSVCNATDLQEVYDIHGGLQLLRVSFCRQCRGSALLRVMSWTGIKRRRPEYRDEEQRSKVLADDKASGRPHQGTLGTQCVHEWSTDVDSTLVGHWLSWAVSLPTVSSLASVCKSWKQLVMTRDVWFGHSLHLHRQTLSAVQLSAMGDIFKYAERVYVNMEQLGCFSHIPCTMSVYWHKNALWDQVVGGEYYLHSAYRLPVVASLTVQYPAGCDVILEWGMTSAQDAASMRNALDGVAHAGALFLGQIACVSEASRGAAYPLWFLNDRPISKSPLPHPIAYTRQYGLGCSTDLTLKRWRGLMEFHVNGVFSGSLPYNQQAPEAIRFGLVVSVCPASAGPVCFTTFPTPVELFE